MVNAVGHTSVKGAELGAEVESAFAELGIRCYWPALRTSAVNPAGRKTLRRLR